MGNHLRRWLYFHGVPMPDYFGLNMIHRGDHVQWIWPWRRTSKMAWISWGFDWAFPSLKAIDDMWEEYDKCNTSS